MAPGRWPAAYESGVADVDDQHLPRVGGLLEVRDGDPRHRRLVGHLPEHGRSEE